MICLPKGEQKSERHKSKWRLIFHHYSYCGPYGDFPKSPVRGINYGSPGPPCVKIYFGGAKKKISFFFCRSPEPPRRKKNEFWIEEVKCFFFL